MRGLLDVVLVLGPAEIGFAHALVAGDFLGLPEARIAPCAITVMSSAIPNTTSMSCSMMTISIVRASSRIFATARSVSAGLMPQVGSSSSSKLRLGDQAPCRSRAARRRHRTACRPARCASAVSPICSSVCVDARACVRGRSRHRGTGEESRFAPAYVIQRFSATLKLVKHALDLQRALDAEPADLVRLAGR